MHKAATKLFSQVLGVLNMKTGDYKTFDTGFTSHKFLQFGSDGNIYCVGGSPTRFDCVLRFHPGTEQVCGCVCVSAETGAPIST